MTVPCRHVYDIEKRIAHKQGKQEMTNPRKYFAGLIACCVMIILTFSGTCTGEAQWPRVTPSKDGTPISYEMSGSGKTTLIFVHGWSCDARYWRRQIPEFSKEFHVISLDLAGHGHSGISRKKYTMASFGEDVQAVTTAADCRQVILIGHSMGGSVIAEAARLMPDIVVGLIGVDTLDNIEYPLTPEELTQMTAPLEKNFMNGSRQFAAGMIYPDTDPALREWILSDISAAPPQVALSAMNEMMNQYISGEAAKVFEQVRIPVICVNGDLWPVNYEANRRHMSSFEAIILKKADHFLMMSRPDDFNQALKQAVLKLLE